MNIIVAGSLGFDYIMKYSGKFSDGLTREKIDKLSLSFLIDKLSTQNGGTAGNIAYTLKLLNNNPYIFSTAGKDFDPYRKFLKRMKISTDYISLYDDTMTSAYFVITDIEQNQIGSFSIGATKYAKDLSLRLALKNINQPFVILTATDSTAMVRYVNECIEFNTPYLFDPAFQIATFNPKDLATSIQHAQIYIGNDYEISLTEKILNITHEELIMMVPILITTLGKDGSIIESKKEYYRIKPAKPIKESDPTGAGDAYRAGFITGYLKNLPLDVCGQMGSVSAVYIIENFGTQTHTYKLKDFINRYESNYGEKIVL